jgi:hypothetical protein
MLRLQTDADPDSASASGRVVVNAAGRPVDNLIGRPSMRGPSRDHITIVKQTQTPAVEPFRRGHVRAAYDALPYARGP